MKKYKIKQIIINIDENEKRKQLDVIATGVLKATLNWSN